MADRRLSIDCLDGERRRWSNVGVRAIPVGNQFDLTPGREDPRWQPEKPREQRYVSGDSISITVTTPAGTTAEKVLP